MVVKFVFNHLLTRRQTIFRKRMLGGKDFADKRGRRPGSRVEPGGGPHFSALGWWGGPHTPHPESLAVLLYLFDFLPPPPCIIMTVGLAHGEGKTLTIPFRFWVLLGMSVRLRVKATDESMV